MGDLFPPESQTTGPHERAGSRPREALPKVVERYTYLDEHGEILYEVCRTEPKGFFQRRYDPSSGIWFNGLGNCQRVLYRLPEIVAALPHVPILAVEGEKDVHALEAIGLLATCNPGGCGMGWRPEYSESLRGRRVVVIPDNDDSGRCHAERVAGSLIAHGAASVRLVILPGLETGGDVSNYLAEHTKDDLVAVIKATSEWKP